MTDFLAFLRAHSYPGRGIAVGHGRAYYFIMGRSENSRNRIFEQTPDGIRTRAFDESKVTDPNLIIYHPVRQTARGLIVTNGDQTDTIYEGLADGKTFSEALESRCFEPDGPNFTPRISGMMTFMKRLKPVVPRLELASTRELSMFFRAPLTYR